MFQTDGRPLKRGVCLIGKLTIKTFDFYWRADVLKTISLFFEFSFSSQLETTHISNPGSAQTIFTVK